MYNTVINNWIRRITYMKPRIFISSTCYDLKFVREDLADFIRNYDYEPILSENGDIGYTPGQNLDTSCYVAMQTSDMVVLIVGSEYGSAASGEVKDKFEEYISITRKEFRTAIDAGIPVFAMIDKKVMAEYGIYEVNIEKIEKNDLEIEFKVVKDLNVFRFIKEIKGAVNIPIQEFDKSSDIKEFIKKQWADMFKNYLNLLRGEKENKKIESSVNEMKDLIQKMNIMLDSVGKNVLSKENSNEYDEVINKQEIMSFCENISEWLNLKIIFDLPIKDMDERKKLINQILQILEDIYEQKLWNGFWNNEKEKQDKFFALFNEEDIFIDNLRVPKPDIVEDNHTLMSDKSNFNKIVKILIQDKYFYQFIKIV